ncbi:hypothetical protein EYF80_000604 [Liparis tanakae]|uniref:Uncharacterized protein n=1 Tax=Liparis tanakae TaxID=230148 RepID=A0A4Z2JGD8_9TELE|nr:hypothetical protein EYF80_000604 [Liparis tanakae]
MESRGAGQRVRNNEKMSVRRPEMDKLTAATATLKLQDGFVSCDHPGPDADSHYILLSWPTPGMQHAAGGGRRSRPPLSAGSVNANEPNARRRSAFGRFVKATILRVAQ